MQTQEYAPGRHLEVHGDGPVVLLWHGRGVDQRSAMRPLARRLATLGRTAVAVDWSSEAPGRGRDDLLRSLRHARDLAVERGIDPGSLVVAGWSLGGTAAVSLATTSRRLGIDLAGVVLVAPGDGPRAVDPLSGQPLPARFPRGDDRAPVDLVYGLDDLSATPDLVSGLELRLRSAGWRTTLHELATDHAGVVGTRWDERTETYPPSRAAHATSALERVATIVAAVSPSS